MGSCLLVQKAGKKILPPSIMSYSPADKTFFYGSAPDTYSIELAPDSAEPETYQWYLNDAAVEGATTATFNLSSLEIGTYTIYCIVSNKGGETKSRVATINVKKKAITYTYDGEHEFIDEGDNNWKIKFYTSGYFQITDFGIYANEGVNSVSVDIFCVGGGGGGGTYVDSYGHGGGGGGGYTATKADVYVGGDYYGVTIGAGGAGGNNTNGGESQFYYQGISASGRPESTGPIISAAGGKGGTGTTGGDGGSGGGGGTQTRKSNTDTNRNGIGGSGGSDGSYGNGGTTTISGYAWYAGGNGQNTTTREFGESTGDLYAGGGGGGGHNGGGYGGNGGGGRSNPYTVPGEAGTPNTGGGGGQGRLGGGAGGSGIVIIRNARNSKDQT